MRPGSIETPLIKNDVYSHQVGCNVFLKMENLQPSGSFKSRGMTQVISEALDSDPQASLDTLHVCSSSGGNAGLAAAMTSRLNGVTCTVVVPESTKSRMLDKLRQAGAEVIVHGKHWAEANDFLQKTEMPRLEKTGKIPIYCHPFDAPAVWRGNSTLIDEVIKQGVKPDAVVCSVGGGGLFNGVVEGLRRHNLDCPVVAVETNGADALSQSLQKGEQVTLPGTTSIATSLGAVRVADKTFENAQTYPTVSAVVSDDDAVSALVEYAENKQIIVEPACGASLAVLPALKDLVELKKDSNVVVVLCGGSATGVSDIAQFKADLEKKSKEE
ncbi:L-serine dehydratase [Yarrowia sp. C11]|nr:L-serine dehydratase [Yarrowia sp. E02]KAG5371780.1 L-serine dehydratase [Yarrowia sp. C11]